MARTKPPPNSKKKPVPAAATASIPPHFDKYRAVEQAIYQSPIDLVKKLRARIIQRGDGSIGPMTFDEIASIINDLAARHAAKHNITPVVISLEAIRRWWRLFCPDQPIRKSPRVDGKAVTLDELARASATTAEEVRKELGL
jgi:hypothetical protein